MKSFGTALLLTCMAALSGSAAANEDSANIAGFGAALESESLAAMRGGSEQLASEMRLAGTTAENTATNVVTGANSISAGSFSNMSGIPVVIQNSGANVLIQNATIVNLHLN